MTTSFAYHDRMGDDVETFADRWRRTSMSIRLGPFSFFWPIVVTSGVLFCICTGLAIFLFREHASIAASLQSNIHRYREAASLTECLTDLDALLHDRVERVGSLHERVSNHLHRLIDLCRLDPVVRPKAEAVQARLERYLAAWAVRPPPRSPEYRSSVEDAQRLLEGELIPACQKLRDEFNQSIEDSSVQHAWILQEISWGLVGLGITGGVGGVLLGGSLTRSLNRSVRRMQIQVRNAVGKFGPDFPTIVVSEEGDIHQLHTQIRGLVGQVEEVVSRLQQKERDILRAEQLAAVGQLAAGVAHEIRNPLTSIKMLVQAAIQEDDAQAITLEDLTIIESEVRRMERSLKTFLDFARPPKPEKKWIDLKPLVGSVLDLVRGRAEKQRVQTIFTQTRRDLRLYADPEQLKQVMVNLLLNALDALPTGGTIEVQLLPSGGGDFVEIRTLDTGPGLPEEMLELLFKPFQSSKETGLGLGLFISKRIVEDHGGALVANNRAGGGACFTVCLPLVAGEPALAGPRA